eukprot:CAMPEP_0179207944 /NCGR_PEP_ID=MMETSP0796-20121207/103698_1 /TAXON_ID=73915 /ORGANISM="Pyrodinium bahamense, Strain pbaha01" /LENGTH=495 /DNA_ID=CAMNT_0020912885 /DNA_START=312 /DNA_END=1797 /DNA_ORIENTATION=-
MVCEEDVKGGEERAQQEERQPGPEVRFGVTPPISLGLPTQAELAQTEAMAEEMRRDAPLETQEKMRFRAAVLVELRRIVLQWIYEVSIRQGMEEEAARLAGAKIFTFGSYRLGLVSPGSDIDALCVAPRHISREAFFQVLVTKLQEHPDISELSPVPDAYVPIIKLKLSGVEIDLLFAKLSLTQVPDDLESLNDDSLLKNLDDKTVRSLNGCRVADHILALVPDAERFRDTQDLGKAPGHLLQRAGLLRRHLLVDPCRARLPVVPALHGLRTGQALLPGLRPLDLEEPSPAVPDQGAVERHGPHGVQGLEPEGVPPGPHAPDAHHHARVPLDELAYNVTESTKRIILDEFNRGFKVVEKVEQDKCGWAEVYRPFPFFSLFRNYLHIEVLAKSQMVFTKWMGWIESKLRHLVKHLESIPSVQVRPWPNHLSFQDPDWPYASAVFMGLTIAKKAVHGQKGNTVNLRQQVAQFVEIINGWHERPEHAGECEMRVRSVP